jgi:hypothetical protein
VGWRLLDVDGDVELQHVVTILDIICCLTWCTAPCGCEIDSRQRCRYLVEAEMMFMYLHTVLYGGSLMNVTIWKRAPTRAGRTKRRRPFAAAGRALVGARPIFVQCRRSAEPASLDCALVAPSLHPFRPPRTLSQCTLGFGRFMLSTTYPSYKSLRLRADMRYRTTILHATADNGNSISVGDTQVQTYRRWFTCLLRHP